MRFQPFIAVPLSLLAVACSSKYGSREEAWNAKWEFVDGGKQIVVLDIPTDEEVEKEIENAKTMREWSCEASRVQLEQIHHINPAHQQSYGEKQRRFLREKCYEGAPIDVVNKETLTKRETVFTRSCNHEEETRQSVCKEWKVRGDVTTRADWDKLEPTYTYFRY